MKKFLMCACTGKWGAFAPFFLRVVLGAIFVAHGWDKLETGVPGIASFLGSLGFPAPEFFAVILIAAELGGGILLILGAFTHWVAKILAFVALVALVTVHLKNGFIAPGGYEYILLILAASISLMVTGAGRWSLDHTWLHKR
jgi:putative oxidoreductase